MAQQYRVIVIGCGAVGAATACWLSRRLGGDGGVTSSSPGWRWPGAGRSGGSALSGADGAVTTGRVNSM
jgi:glycine/D-amino acid oxidase-like deaminating enzyme